MSGEAVNSPQLMWRSPDMRNIWQEATPANMALWQQEGRGPMAQLARGEDIPGEHLTSDPQLRAWIRSNIHSMFHVTSTCAMGGAETAVCDPALWVRGVAGLRIVDASVLPTIPQGPPLATIIAIAERASDIIKGTTPLAPAQPAL